MTWIGAPVDEPTVNDEDVVELRMLFRFCESMLLELGGMTERDVDRDEADALVDATDALKRTREMADED